MRILLAYDSLSGNTKMVADEIEEILISEGHEVVSFRVSPLAEYPLDEDFDLYVLGAWTVDYGRTPPDMKDFIAELAVKPKNVAVFGTGETQWGMDFYCGAVDRMAKYFGTSYPTLKIEQMPHTEQDVADIDNWVKKILALRSGIK
ncbi:flavodoxin [Listeria monocytogenes]|uniref:Flavodoxin n=1 Tax=Listeria monocytogenes TaxID=1639 RepID=A0A7U7YIM9_LISMN|nr:flavodoxin [Listeria monocytogenes]MDA18328.1 flavodoxin [Listeria monocytogenes serotype 4a]EAC4811661.1 flavodoxin [Listeria monocytogenes]EAC7279918.1 flavodoxin [Listeria monocytogenes]EAC7286442.1 flavodoxin [Listeria monocytogenes]EAC7297073.1 flavodoxin [Listeria monocytogenes]